MWAGLSLESQRTWAMSSVVCEGPSNSLLLSILNSGHNVDRRRWPRPNLGRKVTQVLWATLLSVVVIDN